MSVSPSQAHCATTTQRKPGRDNSASRRTSVDVLGLPALDRTTFASLSSSHVSIVSSFLSLGSTAPGLATPSRSSVYRFFFSVLRPMFLSCENLHCRWGEQGRRPCQRCAEKCARPQPKGANLGALVAEAGGKVLAEDGLGVWRRVHDPVSLSRIPGRRKCAGEGSRHAPTPNATFCACWGLNISIWALRRAASSALMRFSLALASSFLSCSRSMPMCECARLPGQRLQAERQSKAQSRTHLSLGLSLAGLLLLDDGGLLLDLGRLVFLCGGNGRRSEAGRDETREGRELV